MYKVRGKLKCKKAHCKCLNLGNTCPNHHYVDACFETKMMQENYIEQSKAALAKLIDVEDDLMDLYVLLVWVHGEATTWEDVHDAWSVWRTKTKPDHKSIVPFDSLSKEVQAMDKEYADAIKLVAKEFNNCGF